MEKQNSLKLTYFHRGIRPKPPRVEAVSGMLPPDPEAIATANFWKAISATDFSSDEIQKVNSDGMEGNKLFFVPVKYFFAASTRNACVFLSLCKTSLQSCHVQLYKVKENFRVSRNPKGSLLRPTIPQFRYFLIENMFGSKPMWTKPNVVDTPGGGKKYC